jgi:hypothetical protein
MQELRTMLCLFFDLRTCILRGMVVLFSYNDNFMVLKDIKLYLENYNFKIHSKFVVINKMHQPNSPWKR